MVHSNVPGKPSQVPLTRAAGLEQMPPAPTTAARARRALLRWPVVAALVSAVMAMLITGQVVPVTRARPGPRTITSVTATAQVPSSLTSGPADPSPASDILPPPPPAPTNAALQAVAAVSATDVWAVGSGASRLSSVRQPLVEHWNGSRWSVVRSPHVGAGADTGDLAAVAAVGKTNVWAVGYVTNSATNTNQTLVEHWNGRNWAIIPSPNVSAGISSQLQSVAAVSPSDVWAVGSWVDPSAFAHTLAEHWNGSAWSIVPTPDGGLNSKNYLVGVTAITGSNVWAVGYYSNIQGYTSYTLVEQWTGSKWAVVPSADTADIPNDFLGGVAAVTGSNLWTVGFTANGMAGSSSQTLVEQWTGSQWGVVSSPNTANAWNFLASAAAVSASDIWAVGSDQTSSGVSTTLIEQWNGSQWSIVSSPSPRSGPDSALAGVAAVSAHDVWAVGTVANPATATSSTLLEHWNGSRWQIVPSP